MTPSCASDTFRAAPGDAAACSCRPLEYCSAAGTCERGCRDHVLYVSPSGDDTSFGCDPAAPKKSITAAIGQAKGLALEHHEIHACAGDYAEGPVTLDYPLSLRGGFSCDAFVRTPGLETIVRPRDPAANTTLSIVGPNVTRDVTVEGLVVEPPTASNGASSGVAVTLVVSRNASPVIRENRIFGIGSPEAPSPFASYAVQAAVGAAPELTNNVIRAGSSRVARGWAGVGIYVSGTAKPHIHDNIIDGGPGIVTAADSTGPACAGILLDPDVVLPPETPIEKNHIVGGNCLTQAGSEVLLPSTSVGIYVAERSSAVISRNVVEAGSPSSTFTSLQSAITAAPGSKPIVLGNVAFGGQSTNPKNVTRGVRFIQSDGAVARNNILHAGIGGQNSVALELTRPKGGVVQGNTLVAPNAVTSFELYLVPGSLGATIENNLFIGANGADVSVVVNGCLDPAPVMPTSFGSNAFLATTNFLSFYDGAVSSCTPTTYATLSNAEAALKKRSVSVDGNKRLGGNCAAETTECVALAACPQAGDALACIRSVLTSFGDPFGAPEMREGGYHLKAQVPCALSAGGRVSAKDLTSDVFGRPRTNPTSIGAEELDAPCPN